MKIRLNKHFEAENKFKLIQKINNFVLNQKAYIVNEDFERNIQTDGFECVLLYEIDFKENQTN